MPGSPFAMLRVVFEFSFHYLINHPTLEIICIYWISHTFHYDGHMLCEYDNDTLHNVTQSLVSFQFSHRLSLSKNWALTQNKVNVFSYLKTYMYVDVGTSDPGGRSLIDIRNSASVQITRAAHPLGLHWFHYLTQSIRVMPGGNCYFVINFYTNWKQNITKLGVTIKYG